MSNHFSAAMLKFPGDDPRLDLTDLFVFASPEHAGKTVLIFDVNPFMPAAKMSGSEMIARKGTSCVATPAAIASSPISLAVSKPTPNRTPSGYIFQLASILSPTRLRKKRLISPWLCRASSSFCSL